MCIRDSTQTHRHRFTEASNQKHSDCCEGLPHTQRHMATETHRHTGTQRHRATGLPDTEPHGQL
eukprot:15457897-Alexandrium_andersonii.AAC.1